MSFFRDLKVAVRSLWRVPALWINSRLHAGIGYRGQRRNLQRGARRAAASAGQSRRRPVALPAPERPGHRRGQCDVFGPRDSGPRQRAEDNQELGTFSEIDFTIVGLGTPREIPAGVVDGHYFEVMGLRPVLGTPADSLRRRSECRRGGGADVSLLEGVAALRSRP